MFPSTAVLFWEYFDAISLGVLVTVVWIIIYLHKKRTGKSLKSISATVAESPRSSVVFSIAMTLFFPMYYTFLWFWVGPSLMMPDIFYLLLVISALCEIIFVWVPSGRKLSKVHTMTAGAVGVAMVILSLIILKYAVGLSVIGYVSIFMYLAITFIILIALLFRKMHKHTLKFEILFCAAFLVMISLIAHT